MTAREEIIAAAKEAGMKLSPEWMLGVRMKEAERFYTIAFDAGRQSEKDSCLRMCPNMQGRETK